MANYISPLFLLSLLSIIWLWWWLPRQRIPDQLSAKELKRIETEEKFRQTVGQFFAGLALVATFALTIYQTFQSSRQWSHDYQLRTLTESLKAIGDPTNPTARVAGIYALAALATNSPDEYQRQITDILVVHVRQKANVDIIKMAGPSQECTDITDKNYIEVRESADPEVQAAMNAIGSRKTVTTASGKTTAGAFHLGLLRMDHLFLDDLDLGDLNFSGADFTQSHFRRTNFRSADLRNANFGGSKLADYRNPGFPDAAAASMENWLYARDYNKDLDKGEYDWRRYRCWVADFRDADLKGTNFDNTDLAGADFRDAKFDEKTSFVWANLSRANFKGAKGLKKEQLEQACADATVLNDLGATIRPCPR